MRHWNFAFQKGFAKTDRQAARCVRRQDSKERAPGRHPGKRLLQHADEQAKPIELPHRECRERPIDREAGTEQHSAGLDFPDPQNRLKELRRDVQHGDGLTHQRQRRRQMLEPGYREVARPSP